MARPTLVQFRAGDVGAWRIERIEPVVGATMPPAPRLDVVNVGDVLPTVAWTLRGFTSNERYVERPERTALTAVQRPLGRPEATNAALIPIRKSPDWWELPQDERRAIIEDRSHHIAIGLAYLPAVARRLHHCRDLAEPFDFVTWFEFPASACEAFEELAARLRSTEEWSYVEREVDIRLAK